MAMNTSKVVVGGLAAGVVLNVIGILAWMPLAARFNAEMDAVAPGLSTRIAPTTGMVASIATQFAIGLLLVWLYAAMRPRFGAGFKTAAYAGLAIWLCGFLFYQGWFLTGMMSGVSYLIASVINLVALLAAGYVGGMLYKEEDAGAPVMASARA